MRIAVVGARGQLGAAVVHACRDRHDAIPLDRSVLDITDPAAVRAAFDRLQPDAVVNCAAYNAVDRAEEQAADALRVNAIAVRTMVRALGGAAFVHYGSDFVFDGTGDRPYLETDPASPVSVYGMSKLLGEWFAADAIQGYVLRVESLFGQAPGGAPAKGSVAAIINALRAGQRPRVFEDRVVSPTYILDCAEATLALLERKAEPGLYHCVNTGSCTWLELAQEAARQLGVSSEFDVVKFTDVKFPAARPKYCALDNRKLTAAVGSPLRPWAEALRDHIGRV
jgi:dTDP-4-dehydrorhamnose reductase